MLIVLFFYSLIRSIAFFSYVGYEAYAQEFARVPRFSFGFYWLLTAILILWGLFSHKYLPWRIALLFVASGFGFWGLLLYFNRGLRDFDAIWTYLSLSLIFGLIAVSASDPRPIRQIREHLKDGDKFTNPYRGS